jgi:ubiquinone/menaquinone biosynthesis C-methylase UbiE
VSAAPDHDPWAEWLRGRRHGDDEETLERTLESLGPVRDRVLANADVAEGETLLDVGCGHGLIAFGAVERVGARGRVIFTDVSPALLADCRQRADELGVLDRCHFIEAPAGELIGIDDASVEAVTARSVLIYVDDARAALREFRRVLRPGGRLSIFEPINRFSFPEPEGRLWGYDVAPVRDLADRVKAVYERSQRTGTSTLMGFDERDMVAWADEAGFTDIHVGYEADVDRKRPELFPARRWEAFARSSGNPLEPTVGEAIEAALTPSEARQLVEHLRPSSSAVRAGGGSRSPTCGRVSRSPRTALATCARSRGRSGAAGAPRRHRTRGAHRGRGCAASRPRGRRGWRPRRRRRGPGA